MKTRTPKKLLLLAAATLLLPGSSLSGQETPRSRARTVLPPDVFAQVEELAGSAGQGGVPGDALFSKALEGAAKGVPADRLVPALQAYAGRLSQSAAAFGPEAPGPLVIAGADALQRGVGQDLLRGLGESRERSPMAVLVLADLVETGVGNEHALSLVREALQRRAREQQMLDMPAQVRRLMRQGQSAGDAVEQVRRGLQRGRGGGLTPPVAPGAEPLTETRRRQRGG